MGMILKPKLGIRPNWGHPQSRGIVGHWPFNDNPPLLGTTNDLSGNGNHGTLVGNTYSMPGLTGSALSFDGVSCGVLLLNKPLDGSTALTVKALVRVFGSGDRGIFYTDAHANGEPLLFFIDSDNTVASLLTASGGQAGKNNSDLTLSLDTWYDIVLTWDGTLQRLYIDGIEDVGGGFPGAGATGTLNVSGNSYSIGNDYNAGKEFIGLIDHVLIYDRALSSKEVWKLYRKPSCMFEVDL